MDTGWSCTLMSRSICHLWKKREVKVLTVDRKTLRCCGVGRVQLSVNGVDLVTVKLLVIEGKLLDFNLLLGMDNIKALGGVHINWTGEVCFTIDVPVCSTQNWWQIVCRWPCARGQIISHHTTWRTEYQSILFLKSLGNITRSCNCGKIMNGLYCTPRKCRTTISEIPDIITRQNVFCLRKACGTFSFVWLASAFIKYRVNVVTSECDDKNDDLHVGRYHHEYIQKLINTKYLVCECPGDQYLDEAF